jgi:hypothetical protein
MRARLAAPLFVAAALLVPVEAGAQQTVAEADLVKAIADACDGNAAPSPDPTADGVIKVATLRAALMKYAPLVWAPDFMLAGETPETAYARQAFGDPNEKDPNYEALLNLSRFAYDWTDPKRGLQLPVQKGGVVATGPDGAVLPNTPAEAQKVLAAILSGAGTTYVFHCRTGKRPAPDGSGPRTPVTDVKLNRSGNAAKSTGRWALAKTPKDLAKGVPKDLRAADDATYAELGFTDDSVKDVETYAINAAFGRVFSEWGEGQAVAGKGSVFVEVQRQGTDVPAKDGYVNNLNFGLGQSGRLSWRPGGGDHRDRVFYYDFTAKYLSDDDFESEAYQASLSLDPPLRLPGYRVADELSGPAGPFRTWAWWSTAAVADWMQVDDPGEKEAWKTKPQFARIGYDLAGHVIWIPRDPRTKYAFRLDVTYALRDGQTSEGGDAQLVSAAIRWLPDPRLSLSVAYDRGENLDSLERIDTWKLVAGARF